MATMETRRARHGDLKAIEDTFGPRGTRDDGERAPAHFEGIFGVPGQRGENVVLVGFSKDRLVGVIGLAPDWCEAADVYWLAWLHVVDDGRGARRREKLLARAVREARRRGGRKVYIDASACTLSEDDRRTYEDLGFELEARFKDYHRVGDEQLVYGLRLS